MLSQKRLFITSVVLFLSLIATIKTVAQVAQKTISKTEKTTFVEEASKLLIQNYVFPEIALQVEKHIKSKLEKGEFDKITDMQKFADKITEEMQSISHDKHMHLLFRPQQQSSIQDEQNPLEQFYFQKKRDLEESCGLTRIEKLENNIGVLEISSFNYLTEVAQPYIDAAMRMLSGSDAIIIDCRKNRGGSPDMVNYVCSYFFEKPTHINSIYWKQIDKTIESITLENVGGQKIVDVPIFVLTSSHTFSGAEEFAYDLQTQKRATIIGEVTGGGANPGRAFPVGKDYRVFIPTGKAINPVTKTNWEGVGVKPDIEVESSKIFETALAKATEAAKYHKESLINEVKLYTNNFDSNSEKAEKLFEENKTAEGTQIIESLYIKGLKQNILDEMIINQFGYDNLQKNKTSLAIAIFQFNTKYFPKSANSYDSLAEAYMTAGNKELAIINYEKCLELNPNNANAVEILKKLKSN